MREIDQRFNILGGAASVVTITSVFLVSMGTIASFTALQFIKHLIYPDISMWESHVVTIIVAAVLVPLAIIVGFFLLCSQRKNAEQALRESEERYRLVFENTPLGIIHFDKATQIKDCNDAFAEIIGTPKENIIGFNLISQLRDEQFRDAVFAALEGKTGYFQGDYISVCGDKTSRLRALFQRINSEDGGFPGAVGIFEDITERKQAEELIAQQKDFLHTVLESLAYPFYVVNIDDYTVEIANSAAVLDGLRPGVTCHKLTHGETFPCKGDAHVCPLETIKRTGQPMTTEHLHLDKDGNTRYVEVHADPIFDSGGRVVQMIEYAHDVTERKLAEAERERLIGELQDALSKVKLLSGFLPICASCKKIRNDKGYWQQIEAYIGDHSEAQFSHGICPECAKKLYPDFCRDK